MDEAGRGWCLLMTRSGANGWGVDQTLFVREGMVGECVCCSGGISLYLSIYCHGFFCICKNRCQSGSGSIWERWVSVCLYYMLASKCVCVLGKINLLVFVDCVIWLLLGWCFWNADGYPWWDYMLRQRLLWFLRQEFSSGIKDSFQCDKTPSDVL